MKFTLVLILAMAAAAAAQFNSTRAAVEGLEGLFNKPAVTELDMKAYVGYWYQMYADKLVLDTIEKNNYCDTATYTMRDDGSIGVANIGQVGGPTADAQTTIVTGKVFAKDAKKPGELSVLFDQSNKEKVSPFPAPYWVLKLGPIVDGEYQWAVVSDNLTQFLFVLGRDVDTFNSKYDAEVQDVMVNELGFKGYKKAIPTYQGADCVYAHQ